MAALPIVITILIVWVGSHVWTFIGNYRVARASGLPYVICPINPDNILYILVKGPLRPVFQKCLPIAFYDRLKLTIMGWEFIEKHAAHDQFGSAFILVTSSINELWCADPFMAQSILARRKDFLSLPMTHKILGFLGGNVLTCDGEDWARQRRIVAPNLNEKISGLVWDEGRLQANRMAEFVLKKPEGQSRDSIKALRAIAINVLGQVAYGLSNKMPFTPMELPKDPESHFSYVDAISLCTELLIFAALVPEWLLCLPFMPKVARTLGAALQKLPSLTKDMLNQERMRAASGLDARDNLVSMLVRLSDQGKSETYGKGEPNAIIGPSHNRTQFLTEDEIAGNMFVFTAAGFDTTANTLAYAVTLLATYPEWQAWVYEEVDQVLGDPSESKVLDYTIIYPKLGRCLALMLETLRLFPPVLHLSRSTPISQPITASGKPCHIPGPCTVYINNAALLTNPATWGDDSLVFRPSRWLSVDSTLDNPQLITPERGTFLPWSGGPRSCPGQKMSQVEFVSVIATLVSKCKVVPVELDGEDTAKARERLTKVMEDSETRLTLQIKKPEEVYLKWLGRSSI